MIDKDKLHEKIKRIMLENGYFAEQKEFMDLQDSITKLQEKQNSLSRKVLNFIYYFCILLLVLTLIYLVSRILSIPNTVEGSYAIVKYSLVIAVIATVVSSLTIINSESNRKEVKAIMNLLYINNFINMDNNPNISDDTRLTLINLMSRLLLGTVPVDLKKIGKQ